MRSFRSLSVTASALAISALMAPAVANAQVAQTPTGQVPPGTPESSTQDDDPSASTQQDTDTAATAQETAAPLDTGSGDNTIVVTGSRIARPEFSEPNPIQAYTSESIQQAGVTNLTDFLLDSPALQGSISNQDVAGSNLPNAQFVGVNLLDLRNLGTNRTLVLVNGRRHIAGYPGTAAVDINTIPVDLIDRVDILTGGTSAVYGADGVSGVVNFILKKNFEGLSVRGQAGISQRGDAGNRYISAVYGKNFADNRGNIAVAYEFNTIDRFSQRKRLNWGKTGPSTRFVRNQADLPDDPNIPDYIPLSGLRWIDTSPGGAIDLDLDYYPDFTGEGTPYDRGVYAGSGFVIGGDSTPQDSYFGDYTPFSQRHIFNAFGSFEFSDKLRFFGEAKYVRAKGATYAQPTYNFYDYIYPDNAYLIQRFGEDAAPDGAIITGRDNFDFGIRRYSTKRKTIRTVAGFDGRLSDNLRYEASYTFGQVKSAGTNQGDRIADRFFAAMDAVVNPANGQITCRINLPGETEIRNPFTSTYGYAGGAPSTFQPGQCVPLNLFGEGSPSQEALDFVLTTHTDNARIRQHVLSAYISGDTGAFFNLPGGPVGFAFGAEYRRESSLDVPSDISSTLIPTFDSAGNPKDVAALIDNSFASIEKGHFSVKEAFGEINLPILSKAPYAETLSVGGALRLSDYTTIGNTKSWSTNAVYAPVKDITFRGTYSQSVRAPNVNELFAGTTGTFEFITDPCGIDRITSGTSTREANCIATLTALGIDPATFDPANDTTSPQLSSIQGLTSGNRDLGAETAKTITAGVVFRPQFIPGLNLAFDWYKIKLKDAVNTPTAQETAELCVDQPTLENIFCQSVTRDPETGYVQTFQVLPVNVANFKTSGIDMALNYRFTPAGNIGTFNFKMNGNLLKTLQFIPTPGAETDEDVTEPFSPRWSATSDLTWTKGPLTINYGVNWYSKTRRSVKEITDVNPDRYERRYRWYKPYWEHQMQVAYDINKRMNVYVGVNNLLDTKPDVGAAGYPQSAVGRFFYAGARVKAF
jgi:outer membrane receptor protein involved in Fe transport